MNRFFKTLLCALFSVVVIFRCFTFPVSADTKKNIELDQYLHYDSECTPFTEYKLIIPQTTYYHFGLITTGYEYDSVEEIINYDLRETVPIIHIFDSKGTEFLNYCRHWWEPGVTIATSVHYLEKGEYTFYVSSKEYCDLTINGFDGEIYITEDGKKIDPIFSVYSGRANYNYIYNTGNHEYSIVVKPGNRGQVCYLYTSRSVDSWTKLDRTITIPWERSYPDVPIFFSEEYDAKLEMSFFFGFLNFEKLSEPNRDYDSYRNCLADYAQSELICFRLEFRNAATDENITGKSVDIKYHNVETNINYPNVFYNVNCSYPDFEYCFIKDKSSKNKIELDKKYDVAPALFSSKSMDSQVVYSFTPSKDSVYNLSSEGMGANPYVAVFDSNDNCIGWYDSDKNITDYDLDDYRELLLKGVIDFNLNLDIELKADQTYYFYFTNSFYYQDYLSNSADNCRFDKANPYSFQLTEKSSEPKNTEVKPSTSTKEGTFEDFVERLYVVALERDSEPEGKTFWCEKVQDGTYDGAYCARFFLTSPEFLGKNKTNEQFVDTLYRTFFDREADDEGRAFWIKKIEESSIEAVIEGFINSTEWCNICASYGVKSGAQWAKATVASKNATAFATRLYTECLGRDAETEGLNYWSLSLTNLERTGTQAAKEFFYSDEFLSKNLSNEEYVMRLYGTFMGRTPEAEGKAYWLDLLNNGGSRDEVFNFFASCPEFTEICTKYAIDR